MFLQKKNGKYNWEQELFQKKFFIKLKKKW